MYYIGYFYWMEIRNVLEAALAHAGETKGRFSFSLSNEVVGEFKEFYPGINMSKAIESFMRNCTEEAKNKARSNDLN